MKRSGTRLLAIYASIALCVCVICLTEQADAQAPAAAIQSVAVLVDSLAIAPEPEATPTPARTQGPTAKPSPTRTPAPKVTPTPTPAPEYSQTDLDLLARLVYAEAGSDWCSNEMQLLVANVVINRINDSRFPDTLWGVIYQRGQYACAYKLDRVKPNARAVKNAKRVLAGARFAPAKIVFQSEFRQGRGLWKKVGNQYFCY